MRHSHSTHQARLQATINFTTQPQTHCSASIHINTYNDISKFNKLHCTHTYMRTYVHTYSDIYIYIYICIYIYVYVHTCIHADVHAYVHRYIHTHMHACMHACMHTYIHTYKHTYIYIYTHRHTYGQASGVPGPHPSWYGSVGGGGAGVCDEGGRLEEGWGRGQGTETAGIFCKPCASQKPFNVARALICALNPTPNPKPRLTAGSKAEAEHKPSTLAEPRLVYARLDVGCQSRCTRGSNPNPLK